MKTPQYKVKIGIIGCGAIGSRIAKSIQTELKKDCKISGLYDIDHERVIQLAQRLKLNHKVEKSITSLIKHCDCMIEATNAYNTRSIIREALNAGKSVLAMSVGKLLNAQNLFKLARKNRCYMLLPSGAIAGIDAIKAASQVGIKSITLTTRKPPQGFRDNAYFQKKRN